MVDDIDKVMSLPARFIDITFQCTDSTNVATKDGVAKDISVGRLEGYGIRVLDKIWGFASSTDEKGLIEAGKRALRASKAGSAGIHFSPAEGVVDKVRTKRKIDPAKASIEEKIELGIRAYDSIKSEPKVVSSSFTYVDSRTKGLYVNSAGARIEWDTSKVAFFASVFAKNDSELQVGGERMGATAGLEYLKNPEEAAVAAKDKALRLLEARAAPSGTFKVVLDPLLTGVFIHEALGHAVEADHVIQGDSILEDKIGDKIASDLVTVYDDPTIEGSFGFYHYDSEGTRSQKTEIIGRGVLKSFLHSIETASTLGTENTGNARSQGFDHLPIVRMSNTYLQSGDRSLEELLEDIDKGVYLLGSKGGEVDPAKGVFQFSAEEGFLIEKGELTTSLKDVALSGEALRILGDVDGVSREFGSHIGFCGKGGQSVPVGDGGAHLRTVAAVGGIQ